MLPLGWWSEIQALDVDSLVGLIFLTIPQISWLRIFFPRVTPGAPFSSSLFLVSLLDKKQLKATCQIYLSIFSCHLVCVSLTFDLVHDTFILEHFLHLASWALTCSWFSWQILTSPFFFFWPCYMACGILVL